MWKEDRGNAEVEVFSFPIFLGLSVLVPVRQVPEFLNFSKLEELNSGKLPKYVFTKETLPNLTHFLKSPQILITF